MTMNASKAAYDLVLTGARICDPATGSIATAISRLRTTASPQLDPASHRVQGK
jgi:hypothetical protein